jgi:cell division protein FtsB
VFDFHEKRKIKSWLFSRTSIALLLVASGLLSVSVFERYQKERETALKYAERSAELAELNVRAAALETKVDYMESARGIEDEIRHRYDVVKEGERAVIIMDEEKATSTPLPLPVVEDRSYFSRLMFWR